MHTFNTTLIRLIIVSIFLLLSTIAPAQRKLGLEPDNWAVELSKGGLTEINSMGSLLNLLIETDSLRALRILDSVEASTNAKGHFFKAHFCMIKADFLFAKFVDYDKYKDRRSKELLPIKEQMMKLYADAIDASNYTEDDRTIGWTNFYSSKRMRSFGEIGWAVMYSKNGVELFERAKYAVEPPVYTDLADLLYQVREYDESIIYAQKGLSAWKKNNFENEYKNPYKIKIKALNTIGNVFYKKNQYDSANVYYQQALQLAKENKDTLLTAVVLGNEGRILYAQNNFDSAYSLFKTDYLNSKGDSIYNDAANAAQWMAKASLAKGNKIAALAEAREAIHLLSIWPNGSYLRDTYNTLTQIFRAKGNYDSAFYYNTLYASLNDSLEKVINTSSIAISKAKINDELSRYKIKSLNKERQSQLLVRNVIILGIILLSISALIIVNRNRLTIKMKMEKAEQEIVTAREQMKMFTDNIIEKTNLIEKLQDQVNNKQDTTDRQLLIKELMNQTILTEDEWIRFKNVFEKMYPVFFIKLKEKAPEITAAEQRMAALIQIQLTTKQIASMLGISVDSVYKTRQRLKQRINTAHDDNIDEFIAGL